MRADSGRFAVVVGHVFPEIERVIGGNDRFQVIEKLGAGVALTDAAAIEGSGRGGLRANPETGGSPE